jgi:hypothetical protein
VKPFTVRSRLRTRSRLIGCFCGAPRTGDVQRLDQGHTAVLQGSLHLLTDNPLDADARRDIVNAIAALRSRLTGVPVIATPRGR